METENEQEHISKSLRNMVWIIVLGGLAPTLDTTIVNVALPTLSHALHTSVATSQWTITGYLLAMAMAMPASGWLTDRLGGKKLWLLALPSFLFGSILSGAAWSMGSLIVFRVLQGLAAGLMVPLITTLILRLSGSKNIGRIMSIATLPVVVVPVFGPVIGGLIIGHLVWRWIFYVNVPICLAGFLLAWRYLPRIEPSPNKQPFDIFGLILLSPALALIIYGLSQATGTTGFGAEKVLVPLLAGLILIAAFATYALRKQTKPLINLRPLRVRSYSASLSILFLSGLSVYGGLLLISLFYQELQGKSALMAGLLLAPQGIGSLLPRIFTGKLTDRLGSRPVVLFGLLVTLIGTLPFAFANVNTNQWLLAVSLFVRGIGLTPAVIAVMAGAFRGIPKEELPDASSTTRIVQQVGASFGTAVLVVILSRGLATHSSHSYAFDIAFWWSIGFTTLAVIPALLLTKPVDSPKVTQP